MCVCVFRFDPKDYNRAVLVLGDSGGGVCIMEFHNALSSLFGVQTCGKPGQHNKWLVLDLFVITSNHFYFLIISLIIILSLASSDNDVSVFIVVTVLIVITCKKEYILVFLQRTTCEFPSPSCNTTPQRA